MNVPLPVPEGAEKVTEVALIQLEVTVTPAIVTTISALRLPKLVPVMVTVPPGVSTVATADIVGD